MDVNTVKSINVESINNFIFPVVLDYDFVQNRPRGGSARLDLLSYSALSKAINDIEIKDNLFIKKDVLFFKRGVFLIDFSNIVTSHRKVAQMIRKLSDKDIYLENSINFQVEKVVNEIQNRSITLLDFYNEQSNG